jgi:hypothetical protein
MNEERTDVRNLVEDIGMRATLLAVGALLITGTLAAISLKAASAAVKVALGLSLLISGGSLAAWEMKRVQRQIA